MPKHTAPKGLVGDPTNSTLAEQHATLKECGAAATTEPRYFDRLGDESDDFAEMESRGLSLNISVELRRLADGLAGLRAASDVLRAFDVERSMHEEADTEDKDCFTLLSPRGAHDLSRGASVLANLLGERIYSLGEQLVAEKRRDMKAARGGAQ